MITRAEIIKRLTRLWSMEEVNHMHQSLIWKMQSGICGDPRWPFESVGKYRKKLIMEAIFGE